MRCKMLGSPSKSPGKRAMLLAWLQDKCEGTTKFKSSVMQLSFSKTRTKQLKWLTTHEVLTKHGHEEGMQMIKDGSFLVRKNPVNTKFYQFMTVEEYLTLDMKKQGAEGIRTVSYTHLTLPTKRIV